MHMIIMIKMITTTVVITLTSITFFVVQSLELSLEVEGDGVKISDGFGDSHGVWYEVVAAVCSGVLWKVGNAVGSGSFLTGISQNVSAL